jgi:cyclophilin family peptidyl-prolyl cis-trans isomerase
VIAQRATDGNTRSRFLGLSLGSLVAIGACFSTLSGGRAAPNLDVAVPDSFIVHFETSRGGFDAMARRAWAPNGVDRLYTLVGDHYYDGARFYRVVKDFVAQFGMAADPRVTAAWRIRAIADEPVHHSNLRGTISYARGGPGTRSVQLYVNLKDNVRLDTLNGFGFPPIAEVVSGMATVDSLYSGYGEASSARNPNGKGPPQDSIARQGNAYLERGFPKLDYIKQARVTREWRASNGASR